MPTGPDKSGPSKQETSSQAVKLPEFMPSAPLVWWLSCKSAFEVRCISCHIEKYHYLVAALPSDVTMKLLHILQASPRSRTQDEDPCCGLLKTAIIQLFTPSKYNTFVQYLDVAPLQPMQKPSELLAIIRAALPPNIDNRGSTVWFIKMRLLTLLPMSMRTMCLGREFMSLEELAAYADSIMSLPVSTPTPPPSPSTSA